MSDPWPPTAPGVNKAFKKANDNSAEKTIPKDSSKMVSIVQIKELESQRKKPVPQLKPQSMTVTKLDVNAEQEREKNIQRMKKRLLESKGKTRDDFQKSR